MHATHDVIVIGAGFAGLYMLHKLRSYGYTALILERAPSIGGTWFWNKYPGARCDTESLQYSYQFSEELQQEWEWTEKYARQPEILNYLNHVADRFQLHAHIKLNFDVKNIIYKNSLWEISGENEEKFHANFCIMATGCLSQPLNAKIPGIEDFEGECYQSSLWPEKKIDFTKKTIAVIGTGSSGMQLIPEVAKSAEKLYVLQRTPNYSVPAHNKSLDPDFVQEFKKNYKKNRADAKKLVSGFLTTYNKKSALEVTKKELKEEYDRRWAAGGLAFLAAFSDITHNLDANKTATQYIEDKIDEIVKNKKISEALKPRSIVGCKRLVIESNYFDTFNRGNVELINLKKNPINLIRRQGIDIEGIGEVDLDMIILATGFDAMTGALNNIDIIGKNNIALKDKWINGPETYLGLATNGFPNFFTITGPGSPSVLTNMIPTIEQHVDWIADCIRYIKKKSYHSIEANRDAEIEWGKYNDKCARDTLRYYCDSWYLGSNVTGKKRVFYPFVGGLPVYIEKCEKIVNNSYEGFTLE